MILVSRISNYIAGHPQTRIGQVSKDLDIPKTTTHRIINFLKPLLDVSDQTPKDYPVQFPQQLQFKKMSKDAEQENKTSAEI